MNDVEWMERAACRGVIDPMWDESSPSAEALRYCFRCPVRRDCADYGLRRVYGSDAGVLGGLGLYDRQRIRARRTTFEAASAARMRDLMLRDWDTAIHDNFVQDFLP
jgi:hypothetical protein